MSRLANLIPNPIRRFYNRRFSPTSEETLRIDITCAKYREVKELFREATLNHSSNSELLFYPSHLESSFPENGQQRISKLSELIMLFNGTEAFQRLDFLDQMKIESFKELQGYELSKALRTEKIAGQTLFQMLDALAEESSAIKIPKDHPFYSTDLVVFKDSYDKALPPNGVYEKKFKEISTFYENLVEGRQEGFRIIGTALFRIRTHRALKKLFTRQIGRDLLDQALGQGWIQYLKERGPLSERYVTLNQSFTSSDAQTANQIVDYSGFVPKFKYGYWINIFWNNQKITTEIQGNTYQLAIPDIALLAHELLHIVHRRKNQTWTPVNQKELLFYTNAEEKVTITGNLNGVVQDRLSENSIRHAYGFFPRKYHHVI